MNKNYEFLCACLELLKDNGFERTRKYNFVEKCIQILTEEESLESDRLPDCDIEEEKHTLKTYCKWLDEFAVKLTEYRQWLEGELQHLDLMRYAIIVKESGGGSGVKNSYSLDFIDKLDAGLSSAKAPKITLENSLIQYRTKSIQKTKWYLKLCARFHETRRKRIVFMLLTLLIFYIGIPILLVWSVISAPRYSLVVVGIFIGYGFFIMPSVRNVFELITKKIALLDHLTMPVSSVAISHIVKTNPNDPREVHRAVQVVEVVADCPICHSKYDIKDAVSLEHQSLKNKRIIGVCVNNPQEHRFSFDKDLMKGACLR